MFKIYGIKNCNTVKKSLDWLDGDKIKYEFLDVKKNTLKELIVEEWIKTLPDGSTWEKLINKSGLTWRKLNDEDKELAGNKKSIAKLIISKPMVMKRPVITKGNKVVSIGYDETEFSKIFK